MNEKVHGFIKNTGNGLRTTAKCRQNHELIPSTHFSTNWNKNIRNHYTIYTNSYPTPLIFSKYKHDTDPAIELISLKKKWQKSMEKLQNMYRQSYKSIQRITDKDVIWKNNQAKVPEITAVFHELIENDPDPHFQGLYNWYYTNGNLACDSFDSETLLLSATSAQQNVLNVGSINIENDNFSLINKTSTNFESTIFELENFKFNKKTHVGVREQKQFSIGELIKKDKEYSLNMIHKKLFDVSITSVVLNKWKPNEYISLDINKNVKLWDFEASTVQKELVGEIELQFSKPYVDNWGMLSFIRPFNVFAVDRKSFKLVDTRENSDSTSISVQDKLFTCDKNSLCLPSLLSENNIFLATYHSVFLLDLRNLPNIIKKWTHSMQSIPLSAKSVLNAANEELIVLSSQLSSEKCLIVNIDASNDPPIKYLKTFPDTIREMKAKGKFLNPFSDINQHALYATSGISLFKDHQEKLYALQGNSIGDVFIQEIKKSYNTPRNDECPNFEFENYSNKNKETKPLNATAVVNMEYILKEKPRRSTKPINTDYYLYYPWQRSLQELNACVDLLAPKLLEPWGFPKNEAIVTNDMAEIDSSIRISQWLDSVPPGNVENDNDMEVQKPTNQNEKRKSSSGF